MWHTNIPLDVESEWTTDAEMFAACRKLNPRSSVDRLAYMLLEERMVVCDVECFDEVTR